jgi:sulfhydrogenase subunit beta (sulfur reductase)
MSYYLTTQQNINNWIRGMAAENPVYFPTQYGHASYKFTKLEADSDIQFEQYTPTVLPPVKLLIPAREELLSFKKDPEGNTEIKPTIDDSFRIIAAVRPCDLKGIHLIDLFFKDGVPDAYYLSRRENTALIGWACTRPCNERAFCAAVDSLHHTEGADIFITPLKNSDLLVEVRTKQGEKLAAGTDWEPCEDGPARTIGSVVSMPEEFGRTFPIPVQEIFKKVAQKSKSAVWAKHVERCFSCGTCNLVCPTCYCFDVSDDVNLDVESGNRTRTWDGCMLPHFAVVGGGHNFRPDPAARQRHRVKRKFEYLPGKYSQGAVCVGCGRCGRQCTADIDIFDIVTDLILEGDQS